MIINDQYQFIFVHIPKCAGTSVRTPLSQFDDRQGFYTNRVDQHHSLGLLDYVHIPLFTLRDFFNADYKKFEHYWAFTVIRDPFLRFPSSLSQQLKMYGERPIQNLGKKEVKSEIDRVISFLSKQPQNNHQLPAHYIHFQKQVDFIYVDGKKTVKSLYTVDQVGKLLEQISDRVGHDLTKKNEFGESNNQTLIHRNEVLRILFQSTRSINKNIANFLPRTIKISLRLLVYTSQNQKPDNVFSSNYVKDFIRNYYKDDIQLWKDVTSNQ